MGVTTHFFAFDPSVCTTAPTIERWVEQGALDAELEVADQARSWLKPIRSPQLGDNKRWYDNLAGDFAWTRAREQVPAEARAEIDRWLSHLFWDAGEHGCACARGPIQVGEDPNEVVYDRALLDHIAALECSLLPVEAALAFEFAGEPPRTEGLHGSWIYEFDGFCALVFAWQEVFERARKAGAGWSLLRWVWY